ncbi:DUF4833 domain-containing protein [Stappia sp.]|jgi:hypothetical protein|uniref:DUF4833 domain-containing protein n=1 Tax=Stappia sp. TaxID=1870903 RepID=UPI003A99E404
MAASAISCGTRRDANAWRKRMAVVAALLAVAVAATLAPMSAHAQEGTRIETRSSQRAQASVVEPVDRAPVIRPDFPVPEEPGMLFYLQRSTNSNTIIYAANFRADGSLDPREPVLAYWRRYNTTGERLPLKMIEDSFAFGVRARQTEDPNVFSLYVVSYPERMATLRLIEPGKAQLTLRAGGYEMKPTYAYVDVDESGLMPSVSRVVVVGQDVGTGKPLVERIEIE